MKLPEEILTEIVSYIGDGWDGLQIAFTCRALYQLFRPLVSERFIAILTLQVNAYDLSGGDKAPFLQLIQSLFRNGVVSTSSPDTQHSDEGQPREWAYIKFVDVPDCWVVWSLQSLLVRMKKARLRVRTVYFDTRYNTVLQEGAEELHRAMVRLCETILELEGTSVEVKGHPRPTQSLFSPLKTSPWIFRWQPTPALETQIESLAIRGPIRLGQLCFMDLDTLARVSSDSLTRLVLGQVWRKPEEWTAALPTWHLRRLSSLQVYGVVLPLDTLVSFLVRHTTLRSVVLYAEPTKGATPLLYQDHSPSLIHDLTCKPPILNLLLQSGMAFPDMHSLIIDHDTHFDSYYHAIPSTLPQITSVFGLLGQNGVAPALKSLRLNLAYTSDIHGWLASATLSPSAKVLQFARKATDWTRKGKTDTASHTNRGALALALKSLSQLDVLYLSIQTRTTHPTRYIRPSVVVGFVSVFPSLIKVTIANAFSQTIRDVDDGNPMFWEEVSEVWKVCKRLEQLVISGVGVAAPTAVWKRGEKEPNPGFEAYRNAFPRRGSWV